MGDSSLFWQALYPRARVLFKSETLRQQVSLSLTVANITNEHEEAVITRSGEGDVLISKGALSWDLD